MIKIIAEASKNWLTNENISVGEALHNAKLLVDVAKDSGGSHVKFQCHVFEDEQYKRSEDRHSWIKLNEALTPLEDFWQPLKKYCDEVGIEFMCTPMSKLAAIKIEDLVEVWKVASPDILDYDLLEYLKATEKPIILSSGMTNKEDQDKAHLYLDNYSVLLCTSEYPTPLNKMGLGELKHYDGLSDHSLSLITGALAVVLGAEIIEKHFKIDDNCKDAEVSLNPGQLKQYIKNIREAEETLIEVERPTKIEKELLKQFWIKN